jgi:hypothetical protein
MSHELSRRTVLRTGAAAGVGGIAAGALGVAAAESVSSGTSESAAAAATNGQGPIVVHVRNARTGELDIFTSSGVLHLRDTGITSRINSALR